MKGPIFDGGLSIAESLTIDLILSDLVGEPRERYINHLKNNDPNKWAAYEDHRKVMGYPKL